MAYDDEVAARLWQYVRHRELGAALDRADASDRAPVFAKANADLNVIQSPIATLTERKAVLGSLPSASRHMWFRSMRSSQALVQSVFGNLAVYHSLSALRDISAAEYQRLKQAIEASNLQVPIAAEYSLADAAKAQERVEAGHVLGKVVLRIH